MSIIADHGPFLRVEEAAEVLRISRTSAYELARRWLETGGRDGLPAVRLGRTIRIPAAALDRLREPQSCGRTVTYCGHGHGW